MPSHLSSIGFITRSQEDVYNLVLRAVEQGRPIQVNRGTYYAWQDKSGAELWIQVAPDGRIIGFNPHFAGKTTMRVGLEERILRPNSSALDGAFRAWASPDGEHVESGFYPFVFDTPDFALYPAVTLPAVETAQVSAFAHELQAYPSEEAYYASQSEPVFAAESFAATGLFLADDESAEPPQAFAIFAGRVFNSAWLTNTIGGGRYAWAHVKTLGGEIDVVTDPSIVRGELTRGAIVTGSFWLSGRLINHRSEPAPAHKPGVRLQSWLGPLRRAIAKRMRRS